MTPPDASPPWILRGDAYALFVQLPHGFDEAHRFVPAGHGPRDGVTALMAWIRYRESDVGAYDELMFAPLSSVEVEGERHHTITRIFVSSEASVAAGRSNWGIPKQLASFEVEPDGTRAQRVTVTFDERELASFRVESSRLALPFDTRVVPESKRTLVQELDGTRFRFAPSAKGWAHKATFSELRFDGEDFPDVARARSLGGASLRKFEMRFPAARREPLGRHG